MIKVLATGVQSSLQDGGRKGYRHLGVPRSGAADPLSFAIANWLAGNSQGTSAIECTLGGLHLRFKTETIIAIAGAEMSAQLNGKSVKNFSNRSVRPGDELVLGSAVNGCRSYVAVQGGLRGDQFLDSIATYTLASLGGLGGANLKPGDTLESGDANTFEPNTLPTGFAPRLSRHIVLRVRPGPEIEFIQDISKRGLFVRPYEATRATDRMGSRLDGTKIHCETYTNFVSSPILPGTLQIPPDNRPILALTDGHCTGGYPRAVQVIRADLWQLGQIAPGTKISFQRCFPEDAPNILAHRNALYGSLIDGFEF